MLVNGLRKLVLEWLDLWQRAVGVGFIIGSIGIFLQEMGVQITLSLPMFSDDPIILSVGLYLLYLGYGVIGGIGLGLGYVSPVSTLIRGALG